MATLIEKILSKLGLSDETKLHSKTTELLRLLELRSTNVPAQINDYGKIVLCMDIAASLLSIEFDKEQALKLSNLRKTQYAKFKRLFEKLLDVRSLVGTKDICIQLGLSGINSKADELLALYDKIVATDDPDIDIKHPQYAAMAVFQACKIMKQKIVKPKVAAFSNLRPTQWALLEQRWDKFLSQYYSKDKNIKKHKSAMDSDESAKDVTKKTKVEEKSKKINGIEDYEHWKQRMLEMAHIKLQSLDSEMEKETFQVAVIYKDI